jgi:Fungal N-terminal domain of STAND proteins
MEPLSIASACVAIIANIINISTQISSFVSATRDARSDMGAVTLELSSLSYALQLLKDDFSKFNYPEKLQRNLKEVLHNCDQVVDQMQKLLTKLSSGKLGGKVQWVFDGRDEMNRLRSSLEAHRSAIEIALEVGSM